MREEGKQGEPAKLVQVQRWLVEVSICLACEQTAGDARVAELERQHALLTQELAATRAASAQLEAILASDGWALLQRYYALRQTVLPPGSIRERLFRSALHLLAAPVSRRRRQELGRWLAKRFGRPTNRSISGPRRAPPEPAPCLPEGGVAYVIGDPGDSARYRVFHLMEALHLGGVRSTAVPEHEIPAQLDVLLNHDLIVLFRVRYSPWIARVIDRAKQRGIPLVFDTDDYVFEPSVVPDVDGIRMSKDTTPVDYMRHVVFHLAALTQCDACTAPTKLLVERMAHLGLPGCKVPNALSQEMLNICQRVRDQQPQRSSGSEVRIGYYPGTLTHQRDFATAYRALVRILAEFPQVRLLLAERLDLREFPLLARFSAQIERLPFVDWKALPAALARADVQVAPLEVGNDFCEAKSELKYFEAGAVRVPTIASPTGPFAAAITPGVNGLLANTADEWYAGLKLLVTNPQLRSQIAENALRHTLATYSPGQTMRAALAAYGEVLRRHRVRKESTAGFQPDLRATPAA